ncbi:MAG: uracil-DNA glycosylase family protein [Hyphomicrobiales bacterium]|nr:uracil-DNA glycosylase family protein [Hyphomicrobiales bacterium]
MHDGRAVPGAVERLSDEMRACRICRDEPLGHPLPHEPRPIFRISSTARICIASQAPGMRAHLSGKPFSDPSGVRLRAWMGVTEEEFYDDAKVAITPMGFCFPGHDANRGDLPPRKECALAWRQRLFTTLPYFALTLVIGVYAQKWHLGPDELRPNLTATILQWRRGFAQPGGRTIIPLPHPSWRNNGWLRRNLWFEADLVPEMQRLIRKTLSA